MPKWRKFSATILLAYDQHHPSGKACWNFLQMSAKFICRVGLLQRGRPGLTIFCTSSVIILLVDLFKKKRPVQKLFAHVLDFRAPDLLLLQWEKTGVKFSFANHSDQFLGTICCKVWFENLFVNDPDHPLSRPIAKKMVCYSTYYILSKCPKKLWFPFISASDSVQTSQHSCPPPLNRLDPPIVALWNYSF